MEESRFSLSLFRNYESLLLKLDETLSAIREKAGSAMQCKKGCDGCCRPISIFAVEAFFLAGFFQKLSEEEQDFIRSHVENNQDDEFCPFLFEGACLLYEARPVICRTHGFPLVVTEGEERFLDFCPLNFDGETDLALSLAMDLETLNKTLSAIQGFFMQEGGLLGKIPERFSIRDAVFLS